MRAITYFKIDFVFFIIFRIGFLKKYVDFSSIKSLLWIYFNAIIKAVNVLQQLVLI